MKWITDKLTGQQEYAVSAEMLGVTAVRVNGKKIKPEFILKLPGVPRKDGELTIEIQRATIERK